MQTIGIEPIVVPQITIADDDADIRAAVAARFARRGFEVTSIGDGVSLMEHLYRLRDRHHSPDAVLLDHRMPGLCGLDVLATVNTWDSDRPPVIVVSAYAREIAPMARRLGASGVVDKPFDLGALEVAVRSCFPATSALDDYSSVVSIDALEEPVCAACGSAYGVRLDQRLPGVYFCRGCWERAAPPGPDDELGVAG